MKAFCNIVDEGRPLSLSFAYTHMYQTFCHYLDNCSNKNIESDTTHYLILDLDIKVDHQIQEIYNLKKQGIKVILMVFDPAAFPRVDRLIESKMLDKIVLFDNQFKDRFPIKTYISDYFFNERVFSIDSKIWEPKVCVFGHLSHGRNNDYNLPQVDTLPNIKCYSDLYFEVQKYNGVAIYDTGVSEDRCRIVTYNKAKAVESLMCGRIPYCKDGIKTKRYQNFLAKYDEIPNPKSIDFTQEEIFRINELTIRELLYECEYI